MKSVRAKFWVTEINHRHCRDSSEVNAEIKLEPVYDEDNKDWSKWTPSGSISMSVTNPGAIAQFELGKQYFVDFRPATS